MVWEADAGTIAAGESIRWALWWDGERGGIPVREYRGIQVVQAQPEPGSSDGLTFWWNTELRTSDQALRMEAVPPGYVYLVTVTAGSSGANYKLRGQRVD